MDDGWDVTIQLQRRFSKNPFSQPINPDTNLRFTSDPDGWTIEYYIDRPSYHSESDEIITPNVSFTAHPRMSTLAATTETGQDGRRSAQTRTRANTHKLIRTAIRVHSDFVDGLEMICESGMIFSYL